MIDAVSAACRLGYMTAGNASRLLCRYRYAPPVFLVPPWPEIYLQDAERQHGFDTAVCEYDALLESLLSHGYEPVPLPKVPVPARADLVEAHLRKIVDEMLRNGLIRSG